MDLQKTHNILIITKPYHYISVIKIIANNKYFTYRLVYQDQRKTPNNTVETRNNIITK